MDQGQIANQEAPSQAEPPHQPPQKSHHRVLRSPFAFVSRLIIAVVLVLVGIVVVKSAQKIIARFRPQTPEVITLTYWGLWEPVEVFKPLLTQFEQSHPGVTVNYVQQSPIDYRERLESALNRNQGPDLFRFHNTWTPLLKKEFAPIPEVIYTKSEFETTFYPTTHKDLQTTTGYVGIPLHIDGLALYYNPSMLENINATPPTTWQEVRLLSEQLTISGENKEIIRGGIALGTTNNVEYWPDIIGLLLIQNGADPAQPTDQLAQDSLKFYTDFTKDKIWDDTLPNSTLAFATEKVAMMIAPSTQALEIQKINPNLKFNLSPVPNLPTTNIGWASYWAEGVSKKTTKKKQELAWQLLKFLSQKDQQQTLFALANHIGASTEISSRSDLAADFKSHPLAGPYIANAPTAQSWYLAGNTQDETGLNASIINFYQQAIDDINNGKNISQSLEAASQGIAQILSQYGVSGVYQ